jgi:glyoxylase I family protein
MSLVTGIGGLFFRAHDPEGLARWYSEQFGFPAGREAAPWQQAAGPTVFAPFPEHTEYFGDAAREWMLNLRVSDLDALVDRLRAAGIVVSDPEATDVGRFARLTDPEGNPIELWQPQGDAQ